MLVMIVEVFFEALFGVDPFRVGFLPGLKGRTFERSGNGLPDRLLNERLQKVSPKKVTAGAGSLEREKRMEAHPFSQVVKTRKVMSRSLHQGVLPRVHGVCGQCNPSRSEHFFLNSRFSCRFFHELHQLNFLCAHAGNGTPGRWPKCVKRAA